MALAGFTGRHEDGHYATDPDARGSVRHWHLIQRQARQPIPLPLGDLDSATSSRFLPLLLLLALRRLIVNKESDLNRESMDAIDHIIKARP